MKSIVGKILYDRYRIVRQLGQNDWSTVYLAEDLASDSLKNCQIKQLQPQYDREILGTQSWQRVKEAFENQGDILKNLSQHPQVPQLLAFFECDREFYLVQEYLDGISLEQKLSRGSIDEEEALAWLCETLQILKFVHQKGIAHLNIQPASLIQDGSDKKFLTDFASIENAILFNRQESEIKLNSDFAPQEQLKSDFHSDIYSLGKTIIYALTGKLANSIQAQSGANSSSKSVSLSETPQANISIELAKVLNKMLISHPLQCYQSVSEVLGDLDSERKMITFPPPFTSDRFTSGTPKKKLFDSNATIAFFTSKTIWFLLSLPFVVASIIIFIGLNKYSNRNDIYSGRDSSALSSNFVEYSNSEYQFALKYPDTWSKRQIDDPITGEIVVFASPKETDADPFAEKVYIAVEYLSSKPTTLEDYSQSVLSRIDNTDNNDIKLYEDFKTKIDNSPARMVIYSRTEGMLQLRQMEAFTIKNNQVYVAIYTAEEAKFSQFYPVVEKMINSWEIQ